MKTKQEICEHLREAGFIKDICSCNTGPKQETFKEDAEQLLINDYKKIVGEELNKYELKLIKWLAASSKKYSEEDMKKAFIAGGNSNITEDDGYGSRYLKYMDKWFEQFKKKNC